MDIITYCHSCLIGTQNHHLHRCLGKHWFHLPLSVQIFTFAVKPGSPAQSYTNPRTQSCKWGKPLKRILRRSWPAKFLSYRGRRVRQRHTITASLKIGCRTGRHTWLFTADPSLWQCPFEQLFRVQGYSWKRASIWSHLQLRELLRGLWAWPEFLMKSEMWLLSLRLWTEVHLVELFCISSWPG